VTPRTHTHTHIQQLNPTQRSHPHVVVTAVVLLNVLLLQTLLLELESGAVADRQQLSSLRAEVARLQVLAANRTKAADADRHIKDATTW